MGKRCFPLQMRPFDRLEFCSVKSIGFVERLQSARPLAA